jgi:LysM repeat protein
VTHQTTARPRTARRWLGRLTTGATTAGLVLLAVPVTLAGAGSPDPSDSSRTVVTEPVQLVGHHQPHPWRKIKRYRVRPGDTPSSVAVRYHAWTAQLIRMNHTSVLYAGQVIRIPVVVAASRACTKHKSHDTGLPSVKQRGVPKLWKKNLPKHHHATKSKAKKPKHHAKPKHHKPKPHKAAPPKKHHKKHAHKHKHGWTHANASRAEVRRVIIHKAEKLGVNPDLALAISWQEAGWQQKRLSPAGAVGAMQVMPETGRWMSVLAGRKLHLRDLHDNVTAGVLLIRTLRSQAGLKHAVAGYYQGLAGVQRDGMYPSTKRYVANVLHLKKRIADGWNPS